MKIVGSLCLETFPPQKKKQCASKEIKQKLRAMGEDIKNGLLRLEIESKNETIIYKEASSQAGQVWILCMI